MRFLEIKITEFPQFITSELFNQFEHIPITKERAISQYHNPNAGDKDVGLIICLDEHDMLIGYIGILPGKVHWRNDVDKFYWNSCWWADPSKGKSISMHLFYRMLQITAKKHIFFELTDKTRAIVDKLPYFTTKERFGKRVFTRFYLTDIARKRHASGLVVVVLKAFDAIGNVALFPFQFIYKKKLQKKLRCHAECIAQVDDETQNFIAPFLQHQVIRRGKEELNWIVNHPWLKKTKSNRGRKQNRTYYFSHAVRSHQQYLMKLFEDHKMIAFLLVNEKDKHFSVPYLFCSDSDAWKVGVFIKSLIIDKKAKSFITFNPTILPWFERLEFPFIYGKSMTKYMGFPADNMYQGIEHAHFQDGDGDFVFTG
jgi:hypothetical protein